MMPMDYLSILLTGLVAGGGAYFGSYLKKKGENLATHEDVDKLVKQVARVTETTKEIESKISGDLWDRQKRWEIKRDAFFEAIKALAELEDALNILDSTLKAAKVSVTPAEFINSKLEAANQSWSRAALGYRKATRLAEVVADKETNQVFQNIGFCLANIAGQILVKGDWDAFSKGLPQVLEESRKLIVAIRKELNVDSE